MDSAHIKSAGSVKIAPAASDSPADATFSTVMFSSIEFLCSNPRVIAIEITAAGMEAEIVIPTFKPRYALAAPKNDGQNNAQNDGVNRKLRHDLLCGDIRYVRLSRLNSISSFRKTTFFHEKSPPYDEFL